MVTGGMLMVVDV